MMYDDERLDAVAVKDVYTGKVELRHRECVGAGELIEGDFPSPNKPHGRLVCAACGKPLKFFRDTRVRGQSD